MKDTDLANLQCEVYLPLIDKVGMAVLVAVRRTAVRIKWVILVKQSTSCLVGDSFLTNINSIYFGGK